MTSSLLALRLKDYRQTRSVLDCLPVYGVFADTVLRTIAETKPVSMEGLMSIRGFTHDKCALYGPDILRMVSSTRLSDNAGPCTMGDCGRVRFMSGAENRTRSYVRLRGKGRVGGTGFRRAVIQKCLNASSEGGTAPRAGNQTHAFPANSPTPSLRRLTRSRGDDDDDIYILELAEGRVYVGRTSDLARRVGQHMAGHGSSFTQAFAPTGRLLPRLGRVIGSAEAAERDETLRYMFARGVALVRGWKYTRVELSGEEEREAEANIRELFNLCRRCGFPGHFVSQCKAVVDRLGKACDVKRREA